MKRRRDSMPDTEQALNGPRELTYRVVAMPADTNAAGDIFGGWLMSQIDIAGSVLAVREAGGRVATVAVRELRFIAPIKAATWSAAIRRSSRSAAPRSRSISRPRPPASAAMISRTRTWRPMPRWCMWHWMKTGAQGRSAARSLSGVSDCLRRIRTITFPAGQLRPVLFS